MTNIRPLSCIRPEPSLAAKVASGPHSTMSGEEIRRKMEQNPLSYTRIVHPRYLYAEKLKDPDDAYRAAAQNLEQWIREGVMIDDVEDSFYLYRLTYMGHTQIGLVCRVSLDEIENNGIRAHEKIRENKLKDLAHHIELCCAQVGGPILMAYAGHEKLKQWIHETTQEAPLYDFVSENQVDNQIWRISDPAVCEQVTGWMKEVPALYIADGHHRMMAAGSICKEMREKNPNYTGEEPWNYVTCVCFAADELKILPYGRVVTGCGFITEKEMLEAVRKNFKVSPLSGNMEPKHRGEFTVYVNHHWYLLQFKEERRSRNVPESMDVSILHQMILNPILGIRNDRRESRLEFVAGEDQIGKMVAHCEQENSIGFLLHPTRITEVMEVADRGATIPPKSTWFSPKLCNGLFIYRIFGKE